MADNTPIKAKARRIVKNPETFRERAIKASEVSDKPKRTAKLRQAGGKVVKPVIRPIARTTGRLSSVKGFSLIGKVFKFIGKVIFPVYFRQSWIELRQVNWPSWKLSIRLTFAVLVFAIIFGVAIAVVDFGLDKLFKNILLK